MEGGYFRFFSELVPNGLSMSRIDCADWCIGAMERGALPVCAKNSYGYYLWEHFILSTSHWVRICCLRPPACHLWTARSTIALKSFGGCASQLTSEDPDAIAALVQIEYLWTDLDAVENYCRQRFQLRGYWRQKSIGWIVDEMERRRWAAGLRRTWLAAVIQ